MFELLEGEQIVGTTSPVKEGQLKTCSECSQIAFRVIIIQLRSGEREAALCGAHYTEAAANYPALRHKYQHRSDL